MPNNDSLKELYDAVLMVAEIKGAHIGKYTGMDDDYMALVFDKTEEGKARRLKVAAEFQSTTGCLLDEKDSFTEMGLNPKENLELKPGDSTLSEPYNLLYLPVRTLQGTEYPEITLLRRMAHLPLPKPKDNPSTENPAQETEKLIKYRDKNKAEKEPSDNSQPKPLTSIHLGAPLHYVDATAEEFEPHIITFLKARESALQLNDELLDKETEHYGATESPTTPDAKISLTTALGLVEQAGEQLVNTEKLDMFKQ